MQTNSLFPTGHEILADKRVQELQPWDRCFFLELLMSPAISPEGIIILGGGSADGEKPSDSNGSALISEQKSTSRTFFIKDSKGSALARDILMYSSSSWFKTYNPLNLGLDVYKLPSVLKTKELVVLEFTEGKPVCLIVDFLRWTSDRLKHSKKKRDELNEYCAKADHLVHFPLIHRKLLSRYPGMFPALFSAPQLAPKQAEGFNLDILLKDGSNRTVTGKDVALFKSMFPRVNVEAEFAKMAHWCTINPGKRKTKGGFDRFAMAWMTRADARVAVRAPAWKPGSKPLI